MRSNGAPVTEPCGLSREERAERRAKRNAALVKAAAAVQDERDGGARLAEFKKERQGMMEKIARLEARVGSRGRECLPDPKRTLTSARKWQEKNQKEEMRWRDKWADAKAPAIAGQDMTGAQLRLSDPNNFSGVYRRVLAPGVSQSMHTLPPASARHDFSARSVSSYGTDATLDMLDTDMATHRRSQRTSRRQEARKARQVASLVGRNNKLAAVVLPAIRSIR